MFSQGLYASLSCEATFPISTRITTASLTTLYLARLTVGGSGD